MVWQAKTIFSVGDLVEARKGERVIRDRIHKGDSLFFGASKYLGNPSMVGPSSLEGFKDQGFTLFLVEAATPPLPTEPGVYLDKWGDTWQLSEETSAFAERWFLGSDFMTHNVARGYAPFTKLEPVPDTAKKVLDAVRERTSYRYHELGTKMQGRLSADLNRVAIQFGTKS